MQKVQAWKREATAVYEENIRLKSKRLQVAKTKSIAEQFAVYDRIGFRISLIFVGAYIPFQCF